MDKLPSSETSRKRFTVNKVVMTMVSSDMLLVSATGLIAPIMAVFVTEQINGGSVAVAGFATMIFWIVKSLVQVPVSWYVDKRPGEKDDYLLMFAGSVFASIIPLLYFLGASEVWHVYALEVLHGIAYALMVPTWLGIFTRHIDKTKESTEWTLHSNLVGVGYAAASAVGGVLAEMFGFRIVFLLMSIAMFFGSLVLLAVRKMFLVKG